MGSAAKMAPATNATHKRITARPARARSPRFSITSIERFLPSPKSVSRESHAETQNELHLIRFVPKTEKMRRLCDLPVDGLDALAEGLDRQFVRKLVELREQFRRKR